MTRLDQIKFYKDKLELRLLKTKTRKERSLKRLFKRKLIINQEIDDSIYRRLHGVIENFVTILLLGEQGSIKSSVGLCLCEKTDQKGFTAKRVAFLYEEFKQILNKLQIGESSQLDELVFQHGVGSQRIIEEIQTIIETVRRNQTCMVIISPEEKYFPEEIFTFVMETIDCCLLGTCTADQEPHEIRSCDTPDKEHHMEKAYVRLAIKKRGEYIGFYIQEIKWNNKIWKEYDKRKTAFLKLVKSQDFKKLDYEKEANRILEIKDIDDYKTNKQLKLLLEKKIPNLTVEEKNLLIEQIKIQKRRR